MPDLETEEGPDPNDLRRHAKRMYTEVEYRKKYRRIDFYRPNRAQLKFHALDCGEKALRAGNQLGKTHAAGFEFASHATALYPEWWTGRRFIKPPAIERPVEWMGWASCTTSEKVRDGAQLKLLGPVLDAGGLGTGLIPLDNIIGRPTMARGIGGIVDTVNIRRETGGKAHIQFKSYAAGREAYQGTPVDVNWLDEDVSRDDDSIYGECLARRTTTRGLIVCSLTPLLGMSPLRKRFKERDGKGCGEVLMTIDDCRVSLGGHIPDEDVPGIIAQYKANEVQTRVYGADMQGEGSVFETPVSEIKHMRDPATFPPYWPWMWALDFRHSGSGDTGHPFAAVLAAWDRDNDVIYVVHGVRMKGLAVQHVAAMKENPMWTAPVAWPHDGGRGGSLITGDTIAAIYKKLGLNMRPTHATFRDGGYNFEAGLTEMENRFASRRLQIASHLSEIFDEYQGYHRIDGLVHKVDDDLLSAIRVLCMDIRFAQTVDRFRGYMARRSNVPQPLAAGVDFDVFTGSSAQP